MGSTTIVKSTHVNTANNSKLNQFRLNWISKQRQHLVMNNLAYQLENSTLESHYGIRGGALSNLSREYIQ